MTARPHDLQTCRIRIDGTERVVAAGLSVAAALAQAGQRALSTARSGAPRGLFCGMGACHDCLVTIDGRTGQRACMARVRDGMEIRRGDALPDILSPGLTDLAPLPASLPVEATELAVIGGGPAGLAAAECAARAGVACVLLDERHLPGGQYFKQPATSGASPDAQSRAGAALIDAARAAGVDLRGETLAWGASRDSDGRAVLSILGPHGAAYLRADMVVIATGAYERPDPMPGWDLPGAMTAGAAQTLLRAYGTLPGQRILVTGNGPLNIQVAAEILRRGGEVAAVVETAPPPMSRPAAALDLLRRDPALARLGLRHLAQLRRAGVPVHWQSRLARIEGREAVTGAVIATPGGDLRIEADCVLMGGNFASDNTLSRLLGCAHDMARGQLVARRAPDGQSSQPDVFIIGEVAQFGGAQVAQAEGLLAGRAVVAKLRGKAPAAPDLRRRDRARAFQAALWRLFAPQTAPDTPEGDTLLCRCESITAGTLRAAANGAAPDLATLKRLTRSGMGRCQSRYCAHQAARIAADDTPASEATRALAPQMPVRPVPLAALAVEKPEWGGHKRALLPERAPLRGDPLGRDKTDVAVIGAGIVGVSTALFLARQGAEVTLIEHGRANSVASGGNAGSLHAQLLSFDHGARAEGGGGPAARTLPLQAESIALWGQLQTELSADFEMKVTGGLMVAETEAHLRFLEAKTAVERAVGIEAHVIDAAELARREPALDPRFVGAAWCPQEGKINPLIATQQLLAEALRLGVRLEDRTTLQAMEHGPDGFTLHTARGPLTARRVVNAAGAFAAPVGRMLGCEVPVFGAPLQMVVTEAAAPAITALVAHADRHLTLKQASNGNFIIGGGWTAGLDPVHQHPRPLPESLEGNLWVAQHVVPGLRKLHVIRSWAAMNINIDGAPILGEDPRQPGLFHAATSNGYTLGPLMGQLTAALVTGHDTGRDLAPFSLARFN
ncbi:FAD-dependent oxidoreductase [Mesobacterium pallidum]|uniref:FAD-dependent oxidoreductase n=1 Tax=Mesobacterium pallidum TaxID=2872037 RepID=UPI0023431B62|nr:FAD-dependent oxidoreductase [Mesobacterium pallidum]